MNDRDLLKSARAYVDTWAKNKELMGNELATLRLDYVEAVAAHNYALKKREAEAKVEGKSLTKVPALKPVSRFELDDAYEEYLKKVPIRLRGALASALQCNTENLKPLSAWLEAVTGKTDETDLHVMAHWMWLVKRRLNTLPVVWHIMPILVSPQTIGVKKQAGGKSTAINRLIAPLKGVCTELRMDQVSDERSFTKFNTYLIGFLDEMAGNDKIDIDDFKRIVTSEQLTYRPMRTNSQAQIANLCSFIGASNNSVADIIRDPTGVRRFFQISSLAECNQDRINQLNYTELWKGIDETRERGYYELVKQQINEAQNQIKTVNNLERFVDDYNLFTIEKTSCIPFPAKRLYNDYRLFCLNNGIVFKLSCSSFEKKLVELGFGMEEIRDSSRTRIRLVYVNPLHALEPITKEGKHASR